MITEVIMPKNGMDMEEGTLVRWLKNEGDQVAKDDPIMEIETDKITMEEIAPVSGVLLKKLVEDGSTVPVLTVLAYIGEAGDTVPDQGSTENVKPEPVQENTDKSDSPEPVKPMVQTAAAAVTAEDGVIKATPAARKLAKELGIDLAAVIPSGKHGEIKTRDVEAVKNAPVRKASADVTAPSETVTGTVDGDIIPMSGMRKTIARRMQASATEIPTVTTCIKVDVTKLLEMRTKLNEGRDKADKISINDLIILATAKAIGKNDRMRMQIDGDNYILRKQINIGVAVGMDDGLMVPVIKDADTMTIGQIAAKSKELQSKVRKGSLSPDEMQGGVITISNLGMFGTYCFDPIINQPEASILGVCSIEDELAMIDGNVSVRKKTMLCLTWDHRIVNGTEASRFQEDIKRLLEDPIRLLF